MLRDLVAPMISTAYGQAVLVLTALFLTILLVELFQSKISTRTDLPRIGRSPGWFTGLLKARAEFAKNGKAFVEEGYQKYSDSAYRVQTGDMDRIILSNKYLNELRSFPLTCLSSTDAHCERHLAWFNTTDVIKTSNLHIDVLRGQLNRNLDSVIGPLADEYAMAWAAQANRCGVGSKGFTDVRTHAFMVPVISQAVNHTIVGTPTCRNEDWFRVTASYFADAFYISATLRPWPATLRPILYIFLGARRRVKAHLASALRMLQPAIEKAKTGKSEGHSVLQWMVESARGKDQRPYEIVRKIMFICLASINSSSDSLTNAVFDLCAFPEYVDILRQEIQDVLRQENGWSLDALRKMKKLDSFMKESLRYNQLTLFTFNRKVLKDTRLSDGTLLPAGSFICVPSYCVARDPNNYHEPEKFDPLRFYNLSNSNTDDDDGRYDLGAMGVTDLSFGFGAAACPARIFAAHEIKLAFAQLITGFDLKFPDGQTKRPESVFVDERITPSRTQMVGLRHREAML